MKANSTKTFYLFIYDIIPKILLRFFKKMEL